MKNVIIQDCKTCLIRKKCNYSKEEGTHSIDKCDYCTKQCNTPIKLRIPCVACSSDDYTCLFQMKEGKEL